MTCGIYGIKNKLNDKIYIGQSINIEQRFKRHKTHLKHNKHSNNHLQNSYNFYGKDAFEFVILEETDESELNRKEQIWIDSKSIIDIYNMELFIEDKTSHRNSFYGKKHTSESKDKMSKWKKENYIGINNPNYGKLNSIDTKIKMSEGRSKITTKNKSLDQKKILLIVERLLDGIPHKDIANEFSIGRTTVTRISTGERWSNVTGGPVVPVIYKDGRRIISKFHKNNKANRHLSPLAVRS